MLQYLGGDSVYLDNGKGLALHYMCMSYCMYSKFPSGTDKTLSLMFLSIARAGWNHYTGRCDRGAHRRRDTGRNRCLC